MSMENLSSTARTLLFLYRLAKAMTIGNLDTIPDGILAGFVIEDCKIAMDKERLATMPGLGPTLDITDAGAGKLGKSDLLNVLITQSQDARKKLGTYEENRTKLLETIRNFVTTEMQRTTDQLLSMIAKNPSDVFNSAPVQNELAKLQKRLQEFHVAIDNIKSEEMSLTTTVERVYAAYCKLSGERALPLDRLVETHFAPK
jgi:hypothetical protein